MKKMASTVETITFETEVVGMNSLVDDQSGWNLCNESIEPLDRNAEVSN